MNVAAFVSTGAIPLATAVVLPPAVSQVAVVLPASGRTAAAPASNAVPVGNQVTVTNPVASAVPLEYAA